ncbi:MAG: alpha-ketoacid dehydrogenase subunit beta [Burkholderiales bacterium]
MRTITYAKAVNEAMCEEMRRDPDVFLLGEDVGVYGGSFGVSAGMIDEFGPERVMDTPISEAAIAGAAVGAAAAGMRPIFEIMFSDFVTITMDQIVNQAAKLRFMTGGQAEVPLVLRTAGGCGTGAAAQHSQSLESWFCHVPGLKVIAPSTPYDAKGLLKAAIRDNNPVIFFEHKLLYKQSGEVPEEDYVLPIGKADVKRQGKDVTIITYSRMVNVCLEAAEKLSRQGVSAEVVDLRTLKPLDSEAIISSVKKTGRALIVHEACKTGGLGGEIAAILSDEAFSYLKAPVKRLCGLDMPVPFSKELEKNAVPTVEAVRKAVMEIIK